MLAREVLRLRGTLASRETEWDVMTDLYFYRDPEAEENKDATIEEAKAPGADDTVPAAYEAGETEWAAGAGGAGGAFAAAGAPASGAAGWDADGGAGDWAAASAPAAAAEGETAAATSW